MHIAMACDHLHTALFFLKCPTGGWKEGSEMQPCAVQRVELTWENMYAIYHGKSGIDKIQFN